MKFLGKLLPFQKTGVDIAFEALHETRKAFILSDQMGLGKTFSGIAIASRMDINRCLVVCPNPAKEIWASHIEKLTDASYLIVNSRSELKSRVNFLIIGYDRLRILEGCISNKYFELLIADEFHSIKNPDAKRSQAIRSLNAKFRLFLSGTPVLNYRDELFNVLNIVDPVEFPGYDNFVSRFCTTDRIRVRYRKGRRWRTHFVKKVCGGKNTKELVGLISPFMLRRTRKDVLPFLPEELYQTYYVDMKGKQLQLYKKVERSLRDDIDKKGVNTQNAIVRFTKLRQMCQIVKRDSGKYSSVKLDFLEELCEDILQTKDDGNINKILVVSPFRVPVRHARKMLNAFNPVYVDGTVSDDDMEKEKKKFQEDKTCRVYIGTIRKNMQAITLTAATHVIYIGCDVVPAYNEQVKDRAIRIGQKRSVLVIKILCRDSIEERIEEILERKGDDFNDLFGKGGNRFSRSISSIRKVL